MLIPYLFRFIGDNIRRKRGYPSAPYLLNYSITLRCNLNCKYCGAGRLRNNYADEELGPGDIARFLMDPMLRKLKVVAITGGEPFLKDDLENIMLKFQEAVSPQVFHITTNGFLTEKIIKSISFLKKHGLNMEIKVSVDDISEKHDLLRGKKGSFDRAVDTLSKLRSLFGARELPIGINQTIFEENYRSIDEVRKLARNLKVAYRGFIGQKERPLFMDSGKEDYGLVSLSKEAAAYIESRLKEIYDWRMCFNNYSSASEEIIMKHLISGQFMILKGRSPARSHCMCLFSHSRMNPNGDIITCSYDVDVLGNIKKESYSSIMKKNESATKLKKVKECGRCWLGCELSPSWVSALFRD